ncbi:MAG: glycine cleavage system aminomethyltransferase GcvT [Clostridiales bacterium]|jgi:aminomethyltransferase|nr:glycine cleavage system aminomethyltransferase GcvT [Clostridiales bacterium]
MEEKSGLKTALYDIHIALGGKITPFAGYLLPVQYKGVIDEHMAVRQYAGLFDISHMGEIMISGPDSLKNLNFLFTNDFTNMGDGRVRYTLLCNENGGIVDDMVIYRFSENKYMAVPNAANRHKVMSFLKKHIFGDVVLEDASDSYAQIALQGPMSRAILTKLVDEILLPQKYYTFTSGVMVQGVECIISKTGYTGEDGYELYCKTEAGPKLWGLLMDTDNMLAPCGLGARDTLRLEASMPLYGHEMNDEISPLETGLGFAVKMDKSDFIGKQAIIDRGAPKTARVGLKVTGRGIIREGCPIYIGGKQVGISTSGTHLPYLNAAFAMALIGKGFAEAGSVVEAEVRGRMVPAEIVPLPFYKRA